jgi:hypothetical protein
VRRRSRQVCGGAGLRFDVSSSGLQREEGVREREREMQGSNQSKGDFSPLTTQLQQAWLQSQIPKVQKRRLSTMIPAAAAQSRLGSSYSYFAAESFADSGYLSSIFPGLARSSQQQQQQQQIVPTTQKPSSAAFLERSCDQSSSGFPGRPVLPMLSSYSTKTSNFPANRAAASLVRNIHHPHRSLSTSIVEGSGLEEFSGLSSSQRRASSSSFLFSANLSFPPSRYSVQPSSNALLVPGAAARCLPELDSIAASDSPLSAPLLENILCMDEDMVQAKNIAESSLMGHNSVPETSSSSSTAEIVDYDNSWIDDMILGTLPEQQTAQAQTAEWLIQEYTRSLSVLVADVSRASQSLQSPGNLWENGLDSCYSEYMFEVLNVDQYIEREAQAPARIDYRQSLPSLESHETVIPSAAKCWFEATSYAPDLPRVDLADLLLR